MTHSVKNRIRLGTIFLFLLVITSGAFSIYYLAKLRKQSKNVLKANYESIQYCHLMQQSLDSIQDRNKIFIDSFEKHLRNQENNITEKGETEATKELRLAFNKIKAGNFSLPAAQNIKNQIQQILLLNMTT